MPRTTKESEEELKDEKEEEEDVLKLLIDGSGCDDEFDIDEDLEKELLLEVDQKQKKQQLIPKEEQQDEFSKSDLTVKEEDEEEKINTTFKFRIITPEDGKGSDLYKPINEEKFRTLRAQQLQKRKHPGFNYNNKLNKNIRLTTLPPGFQVDRRTLLPNTFNPSVPFNNFLANQNCASVPLLNDSPYLNLANLRSPLLPSFSTPMQNNFPRQNYNLRPMNNFRPALLPTTPMNTISPPRNSNTLFNQNRPQFPYALSHPLQANSNMQFNAFSPNMLNNLQTQQNLNVPLLNADFIPQNIPHPQEIYLPNQMGANLEFNLQNINQPQEMYLPNQMGTNFNMPLNYSQPPISQNVTNIFQNVRPQTNPRFLSTNKSRENQKFPLQQNLPVINQRSMPNSIGNRNVTQIRKGRNRQVNIQNNQPSNSPTLTLLRPQSIVKQINQKNLVKNQQLNMHNFNKPKQNPLLPTPPEESPKKMDVEIDKIREEFGIDDDYLQKMNQQKELRDSIKKIKTENRLMLSAMLNNKQPKPTKLAASINSSLTSSSTASANINPQVRPSQVAIKSKYKFQIIKEKSSPISNLSQKVVLNDVSDLTNASTKVRLTGLDANTRESAIRKLCRPYGMLKSISFGTTPDGTRYSQVDFEQIDQAQKFVQNCQNQVLDSCHITINYDNWFVSIRLATHIFTF